MVTKKTGLVIVLSFVAAALIVLAFLGGAYLGGLQDQEPQVVRVTEPTTTPASAPSRNERDFLEASETEPVIVSDGGELTIDWLPVASQSLIDVSDVLLEVYSEFEVVGGTSEDVGFRLGTVEGGAYDGYDLTLQVFITQGLGSFYDYYYILVDASSTTKDVVLEHNYSAVGSAFTRPTHYSSSSELLANKRVSQPPTETEPLYALDVIGDRLLFDDSAVIPDLDIPDMVQDDQGRDYIARGVWHRTNFPNAINTSQFTVVGEVEGDDLRSVPSDPAGAPGIGNFTNLFFTEREDGRVIVYEAEIPFWDYSDVPTSSVAVPNVTWLDGTENTQEFFKGAIGGCGFTTAQNVVDPSDIGALVEVGTYQHDGAALSIFEPEDYNTEYFEDAIAIFQSRNDLSATADDITIQQFADSHPFFYYEDDHGRWIEFRNNSNAPMAECGKPVIYLYPEETTDISVKLQPQGGFTVTEPAYNDGWMVTAFPDGRLLNHGDKTHYPYLFWEGRGGLYSMPENYWVVERENVQAFLEEKLAQLGLNKTESSDFLEFWLPRMQEAPHYKIGFHGNQVMDMIAPLELSMRPDTVVRILMDYEELQEPVPENPPELGPRPKREGFTVIEWGGVLK